MDSSASSHKYTHYKGFDSVYRPEAGSSMLESRRLIPPTQGETADHADIRARVLINTGDSELLRTFLYSKNAKTRSPPNQPPRKEGIR